MSIPIAKQGDPDGLCGIYCLIAFMRNWRLSIEPTENDREAFRYLLRSAERLNLLTADRLHGGYEWHELLEIFNTTASALEEPFRAVSITSVQSRYRNHGRADLLRHILGIGGNAIVSVDRHQHWVLVHRVADDGTLSLHDPDGTKNRKTMNVTDISRGLVGVALLPKDAEI